MKFMHPKLSHTSDAYFQNQKIQSSSKEFHLASLPITAYPPDMLLLTGLLIAPVEIIGHCGQQHTLDSHHLL